MPTLLEDARARITAVLNEIDRMMQSEFPYVHPHDALQLLKKRFERHQEVLQKVTPNSQYDVVCNVCRNSLLELRDYMPILGFILRATNVRNAFEEYGPLQRLAQRTIGNDAKLILSSEWEFFPFMYRAISALEGFVLIGFPACESSNPLLLPLAGHELGHSLWEHEKLGDKYSKEIEKRVLCELTDRRWDEYSKIYPQYTKKEQVREDLFAPLTWAPAYTWAILQSEEMFCDFMGLRMFAEAYLHAFVYLLFPGSSGERSKCYPTTKRRMSHLINAATRLEITIADYTDASVEEEKQPEEPAAKLLVSIADTVSSSLEQELIDLVVEIANQRDIPSRNHEKVEYIAKSIREWVVPVKESNSLVDIVNAGWKCNRDPNLWENVPQIKGDNEIAFAENRKRVLHDIMLKSMEITEIFERVRKSV